MGGSTKRVSTSPQETAGLRQGVTSWLQGGSGSNAVGMPAGGQQPAQGGLMPGILQKMRDQGSFGGMILDKPSGGGASGQATGQAYGGQMPVSQAASPFDRINAATPGQMRRTDIGGPQQIGPQRDITSNDFGTISGYGGIDSSQFNRQNLGQAQAGTTTSIDQLGGANSAFFKNMMAQLQPSFDQARSEAVAAGREGSGNLTGSGFANTLGSHLNRSMGDQQARLADYAVQGLGLENQRQLGQAGYDTQASIANQNNQLGFMQQLLGLGELGQRGEIANQNSNLTAAQSNQLAELDRLKSNQATDLNRGNFQGQLDSNQAQTQFQTEAELANNNAQRFMSMLLGQTTAGVGPDEIIQSGGAGALLGPLLGGIGTGLGGPLGGMIGGSLGSGISGLFKPKGIPVSGGGGGGGFFG